MRASGIPYAFVPVRMYTGTEALRPGWPRCNTVRLGCAPGPPHKVNHIGWAASFQPREGQGICAYGCADDRLSDVQRNFVICEHHDA